MSNGNEIAREEISEEDWKRLPNRLNDWFHETLRHDDPKPSLQACCDLADEIMRIASRYENSELQKRYTQKKLGRVPMERRKNVAPADIEEEKNNAIAVRAHEIFLFLLGLERQLRDIEAFFGPSYKWENLSLPEIDEEIKNFKQSLVTLGALKQQRVRSPGEHGTSWHAPARKIAEAIRNCLVNSGYNGAKSLKDEGGATVIVATAVVNCVFRAKIKPSGFVSAMRGRGRKW